jgi:hypothetical protein
VPLYRCANCRRVAEHPAPRCEPCGLDPAADPRDATYLAELAVVHFDPPHRTVFGRGLGHAACDPKTRVGVGASFTGERDHVTCPACRAAAAFAAAAGVPVGPADTIRFAPKPAAG